MTSGNHHYLPQPRSRDALEKFRGDYRKVHHFVKHYERLCQQCQITTGEDKCQSITIYCSKSVNDLLQVLPEYKANDWEGLKKKIFEHFDADREDTHYNLGDLQHIAHKYAKKTLDSLAQWRQYVCKYTVIAEWLKAESVITDTEYDTYFWVGLPYNLKDKVETHLLAGNTVWDISKPFPIKDVTNFMETLLHHRRFDAKRLKSRYSKKEHTDTDSESDLDDSDTDDDTDDESDSGFETYTPKRKSKRKSKEHLKDKEDK